MPFRAKIFVWIAERFFGTEGNGDLKYISSLYNNSEQWETRRDTICLGIQKNALLYPWPKKTSLNATFHSYRERNEYTVENVYFTCFPGFYVCCNVYKSVFALPGGSPIVLCPHGHSKLGRFEGYTQTLAATFARMGAIAVTYDMVGRGENNQTSHNISYALTLQLLDSVRVLDLMTSLPGVNPNKIACTGESGGGTQTIMLTAVDERVKVAVPVVMVSSGFSGGCHCEDGLPIHHGYDYSTNNAEIAALNAPKPLLLISDGHDWTMVNPYREYPFIQRIYRFYGAENNVSNVHFTWGVHDYNADKRQEAYKFIAHHLGLDIKRLQNADGLVDETGVTIEDKATMLAFNSAHPRPSDSIYGAENLMIQLRTFQC
ncbi:MAG TPA: acetylxylan esterase [Candidatus Deferrimicrobium sp.]|nr:acetylxylan esterase [Candidatus Deferrimicrobium sp.]